MSKEEDDQAEDDAPLHRTDSSAGYREASVGDSFEASKRLRTAAQIVAFEKARAKRAEKLEKKTRSKPAPEPRPEPPAPETIGYAYTGTQAEVEAQ